MPRYFISVSYKGTNYSGFQEQANANTIQAEIEKAFAVYFRQPVKMTGSSRTDTGVHALQNYFHFDIDGYVPGECVYNLNAILVPDIVIRNLYLMPEGSHCRFDAVSREYRYYVYAEKDPFLSDRAYYFPYTLDEKSLQAAAVLLGGYKDFTAFSKKKTQVKSFLCDIKTSEWVREEGCLVYKVESNRFLRGMVRGLVGTMLQVGRGRMGLDELKLVIESGDCGRADFSVPGGGLFLVAVNYREGFLPAPLNSKLTG
jgi:tRNA pseudouridine38-40 synthase